MKKQEYYIYPGRFQPPHNDHIVAIVDALEKCGDPFFIGLIIGLIVSDNHNLSDDEHVTAFEKEARRQNSPERTPFSFYQRLEFIERSLAKKLSKETLERLRIIPIPRPESAWSWICAAFPGNRNWIIPDCGEEFDEMKARFFEGKNDNVIRIPQISTTDGRLVRELWERKDLNIEKHVPPEIVNALLED